MNLKHVMDAFFTKELHQLKEWRDDPEITKKLLFCLILRLKICQVCPLNNTLNPLYASSTFGPVVSRRFYDKRG